MVDRNTKTITVTLTQECNLNCVYCYEHHKSKRRMDIQLAKQIIDYELSNDINYDSLEFDLFGGEPFLEFELVKEVTEYICEKKEISLVRSLQLQTVHLSMMRFKIGSESMKGALFAG